MATQLARPTVNAQALGRMRAASLGVGAGAGTGELYLRRKDDGTGYTYGPDAVEVKPEHRFAVAPTGFRHGYIDQEGPAGNRRTKERRVVPMLEHPDRPTPLMGYGTYEAGGAQDVTELVLDSIDVPGLQLTYTAWGVSDANRVGNLLGEFLSHNGETGHPFPCPVIRLKVGGYEHKKWGKWINTLDYELVDWTDGERMMSEVAELPGNDVEEPPFDPDDLLG